MIKFTKLKYKNFLSTGAAGLEIQLDKAQMTLITALNGSGKSTAMDAICFALFGQPYRNINKPQLVNSINGKHCEVEAEFISGGITYRVVRGIKPAKFEIYENGNLMNQNPNVRDYQQVLETQILKMNYTAFTQVVVMGSSNYIPFMRLNPKQRRDFIESLLDIKIFSLMGDLLKQKMQAVKDELRVIAVKITSLEEKIDLQNSFIESKVADRESKVAALNEELNESLAKREKLNKRYEKLEKDLEELQEKELSYIDVKEKVTELNDMRKKIQRNITKQESEKHEYSEICTCPTCHQTLEEESKAKVLEKFDRKLAQLSEGFEAIEGKISKLSEKLVGYSELQEQIAEITNEQASINQSLHGINLINNKILKSLKEYESSSNSDEEIAKLREFKKELKALINSQAALREDTHYSNLIQFLLKDSGIKAKIIAQYVPVINKLVNKYLGQLDFWVSFNLDEQFNEVIKSRHRDLFTYESFSAGEKQRIDLALMLTWREIAGLKNSASTNLLFLDEILDASLDATVLDLLMNILYGMKDSNIFVISHREGLQDKFRHVIRLEKKNNFTVMV